MLSQRGQVNADQLGIPWRFAEGTTYHPKNNPLGIISFATAELALVQQELEDFANKVIRPSDKKIGHCSTPEVDMILTILRSTFPVPHICISSAQQVVHDSRQQ
jgi:hypothetical protein